MNIDQIMQTAEDAAPWILAILTATTVLAHALARAARAFDRHAATTPATWDDEAARYAVSGTERLASALAWVSALLPRLGFGRPSTVLDDGRRPRSRRNPGSGPGAAILALAIIVPTAPSLAACSNGAIGVQADMIAVGGILAAEADAALVRVRAADLDEVLDEARAECGTDGCSEERQAHYRSELARREAAWEPALECRETVPQALRSWQEGLETAHAARTSDVGVQLLIRHGGRFVLVYAAFQSCVARAAPDAVPLPEPPPELAAYAEVITGDRTAGGEAVTR